MTNEMTVICSTCSEEIEYSAHPRHDEDCSPDDHSDIGVTVPDEENTKTDRWGDPVEKRTMPTCELCERDVMKVQLRHHKGNCQRDGEPSDIAVAEAGTDPECAFCEEPVEREKFREHVRECGVSDTGSELGLIDD